MFKFIVPLFFVLLLGACTNGIPLPGKTGAAVKQGIVLLKESHFKAASAVEDLRCKRSMELVLKMADARGEQWFNAYVQSCPQIRAVIKRIAGAAAIKQGFKLVPIPPE